LFSTMQSFYNRYGADNYFVAKSCLKLLGQKNQNINILDIGCLTGSLLSAFLAINRKLNVMGIDIDPQSPLLAPPLIKDKIIVSDFRTYNFNKNFDVITMKFVIEHLLDFKEFLNKAVDLLNPNGILFISIPDIDSAKAKQQKSKWQFINDPSTKIGHIHWFNRKSISYLAYLYNLEIVRFINRGEVIYELPMSIQNFLFKLLGTDETGKRFIKYYFPRIFYAIFADGLLSQLIGYGDNLYCFIRKPTTAV